jgi:hypothetical protein
MWNVKICVLTVIIGTTGTIPKSVRDNLKDMSGKGSIKELQKNIRTHSTVLKARKVLM